MEFTDTDIMNAYDKSSLQTQDMVFSLETKELVVKVADQNGLQRKEQKDIVADEVLFLLIGLTTKEKMAERLSSLLGIPAEKGKKIATELVSTLFNRPTSGIKEPSLAPRPSPHTIESAPAAAPAQQAQPVMSVGEVPDADSAVPEKLELRPEGVEREAPQEPEPAAKPLTREDVMSALSPRRTMASDIASVKESEEGEKTE